MKYWIKLTRPNGGKIRVNIAQIAAYGDPSGDLFLGEKKQENGSEVIVAGKSSFYVCESPAEIDAVINSICEDM